MTTSRVVTRVVPGPMKPWLRRARAAYHAARWRFVDNFGAILAYWRRFPRPVLSEAAEKVLAELNREGVALTTAEQLFGGDGIWKEVAAAVDRLEHERRDEIDAARSRADDPGEGLAKPYMISLLGHMRHEPVSSDDVFVRFALNEAVLPLANAYFRMYTRLHRVVVWHNFATKVPARDSQLWHRDPEDRHVLKVFLYLTDVDAGAGPFVYACGSHPRGPAPGRDAEFFFEPGKRIRRTTDAQMAKVIPPERWIRCVGPRGTLIFADTRGYHKGGHAIERDRILYQCTLVSSASGSAHFTYVIDNPAGLDPAQRFALLDT